jgi:hypothetical protein
MYLYRIVSCFSRRVAAMRLGLKCLALSPIMHQFSGMLQGLMLGCQIYCVVDAGNSSIMTRYSQGCHNSQWSGEALQVGKRSACRVSATGNGLVLDHLCLDHALSFAWLPTPPSALKAAQFPHTVCAPDLNHFLS